MNRAELLKQARDLAHQAVDDCSGLTEKDFVKMMLDYEEEGVKKDLAERFLKEAMGYVEYM